MGSSIFLRATPSMSEVLNERFEMEFPGDFVVWDRNRIQAEVDVIQRSGPKHLSYINSVEQWNKVFKSMAEDCNTIDIEEAEDKDKLRRQLKWILSNVLAFEEISGLDEASDLIPDLEPGLTGYKKGKKVIIKGLSFEDLPKEPANSIYILCKQWARPDIWSRYCDFRRLSTVGSWAAIRSAVIPGEDGTLGYTIWQRVEALHYERTRVDYGPVGYFGTRKPSATLLEMAITAPHSMIAAIRPKKGAAVEKV